MTTCIGRALDGEQRNRYYAHIDLCLSTESSNCPSDEDGFICLRAGVPARRAVGAMPLVTIGATGEPFEVTGELKRTPEVRGRRPAENAPTKRVFTRS